MRTGKLDTPEFAGLRIGDFVIRPSTAADVSAGDADVAGRLMTMHDSEGRKDEV